MNYNSISRFTPAILSQSVKNYLFTLVLPDYQAPSLHFCAILCFQATFERDNVTIGMNVKFEFKVIDHSFGENHKIF